MPAGLSSSTLNLKFMQRAAARTPTSAPSTPAAPPTSTPSKSDDIPTASTPQADNDETRTIASEEPYRWKIDRPSRPAQPALLVPTSSGPRFESSYMPFMDQEPSVEAGPSRNRNGGGGRMMFGYVEPEQEDVDEAMEGGENEEGEQAEDDVVINVRDTGKEAKKHGRNQSSTMSRGFLRPRSRSVSPQRQRPDGTSTPSKSSMTAQTSGRSVEGTSHTAKGKEKARIAEVKDKKPHPNGPSKASAGTKDRPIDVDIKQGPSSQRPASNQGRKDHDAKGKKKRKQCQINASTSSKEEKKPRLEPSLLNDYPSQTSERSTPITAGSSNVSSPKKSGGGTLDDRENALKAQRQKEKRARKKAKKEAVKVE